MDKLGTHKENFQNYNASTICFINRLAFSRKYASILPENVYLAPVKEKDFLENKMDKEFIWRVISQVS